MGPITKKGKKDRWEKQRKEERLTDRQTESKLAHQPARRALGLFKMPSRSVAVWCGDTLLVSALEWADVCSVLNQLVLHTKTLPGKSRQAS